MNSKIITRLRVLLNLFHKIINFIFKIIITITPPELRKNNRTELELKIENNLAEETFNYFREDFKKSLLFRNVQQIRRYAIQTSLQNDKDQKYYYLEFGVYKGESANYFSKFVNKLYCFDSFEGLSEDWIGTRISKSYFNLERKIPKLNSNVETIVGWVEDTLDDFLKKHNLKINFVHLDMDTYSPTKFILEKIKPYLVKNSIIIFDEYYNYEGWKDGEFKALNEVFGKEQFRYKAFTTNADKVVIQII